MEILKIYPEEQKKHLILPKFQNTIGCQHGLASTVYKFFDETSGGTSTHRGTAINSEN